MLCMFLRAPALPALQAPSSSPSDVSRQLLDICDVVDACGGLSIHAVIQTAYSVMGHGSSGEHGMLSYSRELLRSQWLRNMWMHDTSVSSGGQLKQCPHYCASL